MYNIFVDSNCKRDKQELSASIISDANMYEQAIESGEDHDVFLITPSAYASKNYEMALDAAETVAEHGGNGKVHVIDLDMACSGLMSIIKEIIRLEEIGLAFDEIVGRIEVYRNGLVPFCA